MLARAKMVRPEIQPERVSVRVEHPRGAWAARVLRRRAADFSEALLPGELSILVTTDRAIRRLNRRFRGIDRATDVLSFPPDPGSGLAGDVAISLDTAWREAAREGRPLSDELSRLLAHGLLHLAGHDHHRPSEARRMAAAEVDLLGRVGLVGQALGHPKDLVFQRGPLSRRPRKAPDARRAPEKEST